MRSQPSTTTTMGDDNGKKEREPNTGETISMSVAMFVYHHDNASMGSGKPNHAKNTNTLRDVACRSTAAEYLRRGVSNETTLCVSSASSKEWDTPLQWLEMTKKALPSLGEKGQRASADMESKIDKLLQAGRYLSWSEVLRATMWDLTWGLPSDEFNKARPSCITVQGQHRF